MSSTPDAPEASALPTVPTVLVHVVGVQDTLKSDPYVRNREGLARALARLGASPAPAVYAVCLGDPERTAAAADDLIRWWNAQGPKPAAAPRAGGGKAGARNLRVLRSLVAVHDMHDPREVGEALDREGTRARRSWVAQGSRASAPEADAAGTLVAALASSLGQHARRRRFVVSALAGTPAAWSVVLERLVDELFARGVEGDRALLLVPREGADPRGKTPERDREVELLEVATVPPRAQQESPQRLLSKAARLPAGCPVLLRGESGAGKTRLARELHRRWWPGGEGRFEPVNASTLAPEVASAWLFGAAKGAYTGAVADRAGVFGAFEKAPGTLFLDEVGDLPRATQAMLLTALEPEPGPAGEVWSVRGVGASTVTRVATKNLRVVLATNRDVGDEAVFRGDLFARLRGLAVTLPSLDEARHRVVPEWLAQVRRRSTGVGAGENQGGAVTVPRDVAYELARRVFSPRARVVGNFRGIQAAALRTALEVPAEGGAGRKLTSEQMRAGLEAMLEAREVSEVSEGASSARAAEPRVVEVEAPLRADRELPLGAEFGAFAKTERERWTWPQRYEAWLLWSAYRASGRNAAAAWGALKSAYPGPAPRNASDAFWTRWRKLFGERRP